MKQAVFVMGLLGAGLLLDFIALIRAIIWWDGRVGALVEQATWSKQSDFHVDPELWTRPFVFGRCSTLTLLPWGLYNG